MPDSRVIMNGGTPGAGKTKLGAVLAARQGFLTTSMGDLHAAGKAVTWPVTHPALHCMRRVSRPQDVTYTPVERLIGRRAFTPYITRQGGWRATIEGVRVDRRLRGAGLGRQLFSWAIERARQRGCHLVQLTTDKQRPAAKRFCESLGFTASHEGMKLELTVTPQSAGRMLHRAH